MDAQKRYHKAEELALLTALKHLKELLAGTEEDPKKAFVRTFDSGFALGFATAQLMQIEFDISTVDTNKSTLPV